MKKESLSNAILVASLIFVTVLCRLATNYFEIYNFTAMGAGALFAGVILKDKKYAYAVPLISLLLTDLFFYFFTDIQGIYGGEMLFVYAGHMLVTFIGTRIRKVTTGRVFLGAVASGLVFYLMSNMGTFIFRDLYPHTLSGLITCYWSAIPFYKQDVFGSFFLNTIMGNVFYTAILFSAYAVLKPVFIRGEKKEAAIA
ncbi:DUF6580 family putative transport protein [Chitinophaga caseinilytica]|uniref:DUF6580 family putative transport protein n=1 Tax=Chitinophaga caseinilytica TaxID=2267521 RepID=A0ABZ2YXY8_9BACT